ncbi:hypothetical protein [Bradyrhizobium ottawaense]|uniref:hypothetical protein n=1 Tax=Bradyrhizobium ottawaense TaxID=931866 RepID=UPI00117825AE|nr:hypothetical protein [Bradyrhizobium ottawaense]
MTRTPIEAAQGHLQSRGRHYDIIREAIAAYDEYMLDDDYDAQGALDKIIKKMRERLDMAAAPAAPVEPCPYAIDGCVLEKQEIGPCLCANPVQRSSADNASARLCHRDDPYCLHPECNCGAPAADTSDPIAWIKETYLMWLKGDLDPPHMRLGQNFFRTSAPERGNYEDRHPTDDILWSASDHKDFIEVVEVLGLQESEQTPADAVRELQAEVERLDTLIPDVPQRAEATPEEIAMVVGQAKTDKRLITEVILEHFDVLHKSSSLTRPQHPTGEK